MLRLKLIRANKNEPQKSILLEYYQGTAGYVVDLWCDLIRASKQPASSLPHSYVNETLICPNVGNLLLGSDFLIV